MQITHSLRLLQNLIQHFCRKLECVIVLSSTHITFTLNCLFFYIISVVIPWIGNLTNENSSMVVLIPIVCWTYNPEFLIKHWSLSLADDDITSRMFLECFTEVCSMPQRSLLMSIQSSWTHAVNLLKSFMQLHPKSIFLLRNSHFIWTVSISILINLLSTQLNAKLLYLQIWI
jgi:hypothetical protein